MLHSAHLCTHQAELRDDEDDQLEGEPLVESSPPAAGPEADILSHLLQEAESSAEKPDNDAPVQPAGAAGSNTTSGGVTPSPTLESSALGAESDFSNETGLLPGSSKLEEDPQHGIAEAREENGLETSLQAPVSPGITIA